MSENKTTTIIFVAGSLLAIGTIFAIAKSKKELEDDERDECSTRLTTFTGLMDVVGELQKYKGKSCISLVDQYVQNNQAQEYAKLVAAGTISSQEAEAALVGDVTNINTALQGKVG